MTQAQAAPEAKQAEAAKPAPVEPAKPAKPAASAHAASSTAKGNEMFNNFCSHCHGPDAVTGEKRQNLRNLSKKYGERMNEIFATTLANGRLSKGMPKWAGVISDEEIAIIKAYVDTVQDK